MTDEERIKGVDNAVRVLNEALEQDYQAIYVLMHIAVTVNETLADHPTIQVGKIPGQTDGLYRLRPLGLINGLFGTHPNTTGYIGMTMDGDRITHFTRLDSHGKPVDS